MGGGGCGGGDESWMWPQTHAPEVDDLRTDMRAVVKRGFTTQLSAMQGAPKLISVCHGPVRLIGPPFSFFSVIWPRCPVSCCHDKSFRLCFVGDVRLSLRKSSIEFEAWTREPPRGQRPGTWVAMPREELDLFGGFDDAGGGGTLLWSLARCSMLWKYKVNVPHGPGQSSHHVHSATFLGSGQ